MISDLQKRTAKAIVTIFETGRPEGDYGNVTVARHDLGHLTYGYAQTTLASGNLHLLIKSYCSATDAQFADDLGPYLPRLEVKDLSLDHDAACHAVLRSAGNDPVMRATQDAFFDRVFWQPAATAAARQGIESALGTAVVYDSHIHGSWRLMRDRTNATHGEIAAGLDERDWVEGYVGERRSWLADHPNALLPRTVYRMDAFGRLIEAGAWDLPLPLAVRGWTLTEELLMAAATLRASAEVLEERLLRLREPFMHGEDVREVQSALRAQGFAVVVADGVFGPGTYQAVRRFQERNGLVTDGIVGAATRAALGI